MLAAQQRGELSGGRRLYGWPGEDGGQQGRLLVLLDEEAGRDGHHLPGVEAGEAGEVAQLPDGQRSVGEHRLDGGEGEVGAVTGGGGALALHARVRLAVNQITGPGPLV